MSDAAMSNSLITESLPLFKSEENRSSKSASNKLSIYAPNPEPAKGADDYVYDTCEISAIFMQRHKHQIHLSLGHWFCLAHKLDDLELRDAVTALCAKRVIVRKGYNRLSLQTLERFNSGEF